MTKYINFFQNTTAMANLDIDINSWSHDVWRCLTPTSVKTTKIKYDVFLITYIFSEKWHQNLCSRRATDLRHTVLYEAQSKQNKVIHKYFSSTGNSKKWKITITIWLLCARKYWWVFLRQFNHKISVDILL